MQLRQYGKAVTVLDRLYKIVEPLGKLEIDLNFFFPLEVVDGTMTDIHKKDHSRITDSFKMISI